MQTPKRTRLKLQHDGDRSVVDELDLHARAEDAGLDLHARAASASQKPRRAARRPPAARRSEKLGRLPFAVSAISVNWLTTSAAPPMSSEVRSNLPSSFWKMRRRATLPASRSASSRVSPSATPSSTHRPGPISPPGRRDARPGDPLDDRSHIEVADPRRVVGLARPQRAGELVVAVRLGGLALLLQAAAERVVRVVVGRRELEHRAELLLGLVVAADAEVRDAERLADRRLVRLAPLRLLERDGRLRGHAVLEVRAALLEEVVGRLAHASDTESSPPPSQADPSSRASSRSRSPRPLARVDRRAGTRARARTAARVGRRRAARRRPGRRPERRGGEPGLVRIGIDDTARRGRPRRGSACRRAGPAGDARDRAGRARSAAKRRHEAPEVAAAVDRVRGGDRNGGSASRARAHGVGGAVRLRLAHRPDRVGRTRPSRAARSTCSARWPDHDRRTSRTRPRRARAAASRSPAGRRSAGSASASARSAAAAGCPARPPSRRVDGSRAAERAERERAARAVRTCESRCRRTRRSSRSSRARARGRLGAPLRAARSERRRPRRRRRRASTSSCASSRRAELLQRGAAGHVDPLVERGSRTSSRRHGGGDRARIARQR